MPFVTKNHGLTAVAKLLRRYAAEIHLRLVTVDYNH
jgi:hypothetical protein